jgi:site-specific recombinase XerD
MDVERGLSPATIATVRHSLRKFFKHTRAQQLFKLKIADVERFFVLLGKQGWTRHGIRSMAHQLRLFFRYGEQMGWTKPETLLRFHLPATVPVKYLVITTGNTVDSGTPCPTSQARKSFSERLRLTIVASANPLLV